jgi:tRNA A-37 threonylcarbamoyl transferase component Bud32
VFCALLQAFTHAVATEVDKSLLTAKRWFALHGERLGSQPVVTKVEHHLHGTVIVYLVIGGKVCVWKEHGRELHQEIRLMNEAKRLVKGVAIPNLRLIFPYYMEQRAGVVYSISPEASGLSLKQILELFAERQLSYGLILNVYLLLGQCVGMLHKAGVKGPNKTSYSHNDLHSGNIFFDEEQNSITFIDNGTIGLNTATKDIQSVLHNIIKLIFTAMYDRIVVMKLVLAFKLFILRYIVSHYCPVTLISILSKLPELLGKEYKRMQKNRLKNKKAPKPVSKQEYKTLVDIILRELQWFFVSIIIQRSAANRPLTTALQHRETNTDGSNDKVQRRRLIPICADCNDQY